MIGFTGAVLLVVSAAATWFDLWGQLPALPFRSLCGSSLGVYLIVRGFKPSPVTAAMATA